MPNPNSLHNPISALYQSNYITLTHAFLSPFAGGNHNQSKAAATFPSRLPPIYLDLNRSSAPQGIPMCALPNGSIPEIAQIMVGGEGVCLVGTADHALSHHGT